MQIKIDFLINLYLRVIFSTTKTNKDKQRQTKTNKVAKLQNEIHCQKQY
jgi:hypothetical protein